MLHPLGQKELFSVAPIYQKLNGVIPVHGFYQAEGFATKPYMRELSEEGFSPDRVVSLKKREFISVIFYFYLTLEMSKKAAEYGQLFFLAFIIMVLKTNTASMVLLPLLNPNCSGPSRPFASAARVILSHILTVMSRSMLDGMVIGLYWPVSRVSPPYKITEVLNFGYGDDGK